MLLVEPHPADFHTGLQPVATCDRLLLRKVHGYGVGFSIGAAVFPADGQTAGELMAKADERMYEDKETRKRAA